jgi:hypothetical protein
MRFECIRCSFTTPSLTGLYEHVNAVHSCWRSHDFGYEWARARPGAEPVCIRCGFDAREAA